MKSALSAVFAVAAVWAVCYFGFEYPRAFAVVVAMVIGYFAGVVHTSWSLFREREEQDPTDLPTTL